MKKEDIILYSNQDNLALSVSLFIPKGKIKGIIQISHGMAEHKERYFNFMEYLTKKGYVTIIHDHRGHGASIKRKEDLGYFYETKAEMIVEDLYQISQYGKKRFQNQKFILFGHSMGSMVVRKYIKKYDQTIDALIVCGSPSKNSLIGIALLLVNIMKLWKKDTYRSPLIQSLAFGSYNNKIKNPTSSNAWVCSYEKTLQDYDKDPLCGYIFTLNGFQNLFHLMQDIYSKKDWVMKNPALPILFLAGSEDPVIQNYDMWIKSQAFLKRLGYRNITNYFYDGLRHEILNEENYEVIYEDILKFIEKECEKKGKS